ncbi:PREDICTED: arginine/serine-rich protein PNISR isoform X1 [Papilio xuthus]|uniref:Arginine/serine-rich protein PNISR isoform X1 n=1 Tax=Papilio xuthus TaxID=66420 RepID=A0AAJ6ZIY9_PAPXU|nr:PREDICTED: arginine/serine-rich protein PNISR isoform X1 [Papilio xuthus]
MFSGKDAVNPAYPTQWALNPTAYQNIDSSQVDWATLAQQWIAMKEAVVSVPQPPPKPDLEGGEAPMEVENPDTNSESVPPAGAAWNASTNSWGNSWDQWGWGWDGNDSKIAADPSISIPPLMDGYNVPPENAANIPGYTTAAVTTPTFQHGYWTASQGDQANNRSNSRNRENRSKIKNAEPKPLLPRNIRPPREKIHLIPTVVDPMTMPMPGTTMTIDAAKRRQLPAWIREGLEKMEREKQRAIEREQEQKAREEAEREKKRLEEEELARMKAEASGQPMLPAKSKFDSDSETEELSKEDRQKKEVKPSLDRLVETPDDVEEEGKSVLVKKSKEEIMQEVMFAVRRSLTEILLEVTDQEIHTVSQEELARYNAAQASRLNAMKASKSKALAAIASGLGLGAYDSSSGESADEDDQNNISDQQLQEMIKRKKQEFERTARDIEAEVRRAELRETAEEPTTPVTTPDRPARSRSSATPPPIETDTPEKRPERRISKDKRNNNKSIDKVDSARRLSTIQEEKVKKINKWEQTPSPRAKATSDADSSSSSSDSEDSSSSTSSTSSHSEVDIKPVKTKKRKRASSNDIDSKKKSSKQTSKRSHRTDEKNSKSNHNDHDKYKSRSKTKKESDRHKSSRSDKHKDKYRVDSEDERHDRTRKRSRRSTSYESKSGRKKASRDRSQEKRRRDKKSHDRDRSYDRSGRDYDRSGRDHDRSGRDHDRSGRDYEKHDRYERRRSRSRSRSRHRR